MQSTDSHDGQIQGATVPPPPVGGENSPSKDKSGLFAPGDMVGGSYQILDMLGRGAMGVVYRAKHVSMDAEYALKVLTTNLTDVAVMRFQNEAQAIAKLNHPNIIAIYNFGLHDGRLPFYVMDLLSGDNLMDKLDAHGPMPLSAALPVFIEVCAGLSYAHRKGILHRDIKPANFVLLNAPDVRGARVKVVDFGIVKFAEEIKPDAQKLTAMGDVLGSPSYMSPEQSSGDKIDPRSDIYSVGCSLFQALTGKLPYRGRNATETMMMHHSAPVPTLASQGEGRSYSEEIERMVAKLLAKAPMDRYQSMDSVAQDLKNIMDGKPLGTPQVLPTGPGGGSADGDTAINLNPLSRTVPPGTISGAGLPARNPSIKAVEFTDAERENIQRSMSGRLFDADADNELEGPREAAPSQSKALVIALASVVSVCVLGAGLYFGWHALHPAKQSVIDVPAAQQKATEKALPQVDLGIPQISENVGPIELTKEKYFSKTISKNGKQCIEFDFPKPSTAVTLAWVGSGMNDNHVAVGKVVIPKGRVPIFLTPAPPLLKVPQFFDKFRPGDIQGISFLPGTATDDLLILGCRVPGISLMMINQGSNLTEKFVPALSKLHLSIFEADGLPVDGAKMAKAHIWQNLNSLSLSKGKNLTPVLKELSGSKNLFILDVSENALHGPDYKLISTITSLRTLDLTKNRVTAEDLHALSRLPNLSAICLFHARLDPGSLVAELPNFRALRNVTLLRGYVKAADLKLLQERCPGLRIIEQTDEERNKAKFARRELLD